MCTYVYICAYGVLYAVARSWLLFLHDESEWNNFESDVA